MNFDYDLIERIGATHYCDVGDRLYKLGCGFAFVASYVHTWQQTMINMNDVGTRIKPIPPRPQVEYAYELVTDNNFWELREEYDAGELFRQCESKYLSIKTLPELLESYEDNNIYRRKAIEHDSRTG